MDPLKRFFFSQIVTFWKGILHWHVLVINLKI